VARRYPPAEAARITSGEAALFAGRSTAVLTEIAASVK
jgi:hypothetical protein